MDVFSDPARRVSFHFSNPCLDLKYFYCQPAEVDDDIAFYIPSSHPGISRTIRLNNDFYEVWSPNSNAMDFYPGKPLVRKDLPYAFADGRMGPNDWTIHPQPFSSATPWWGFCRVAPLISDNWFNVDAELVPLPIVWQHSCSHPGFGRIEDSYLRGLNARAAYLGNSTADYSYWGTRDDQVEHVLRHRPTFPSPNDMQRISSGGYWMWQDLVIVFTKIQRGLREMEAWLTMMKHWGRRGERSSTIPMVNGDRLGVWLNGASEFEGLWLLRIGVIPIYVIHRYAAEVDFPIHTSVICDRRSRPFFSSFIESTPAERLNSADWNLYLKAFHSSHSGKTSTYVPHPPTILQLGSSAESCTRSSSWAFGMTDQARLPADTRGDLGVDTTSGSMGWGGPESWPDIASSINLFWDSMPPSELAPENTTPAEPSSNQKLGEMICEGSISFWKPPPVAYGPESRQLAGKRRGKKKKKTKTTWISFYETDAPDIPVPNGQTAMLLKSRRSGDESDESDDECGPSLSHTSRTYWDRHLGHRLVFLRPLARNENMHYDSSVFGIPLPDITFWSDDNNRYKRCRKSIWAYLDPHPRSRTQVGLEPSLSECRPKLSLALMDASPLPNFSDTCNPLPPRSMSRSADALASDEGTEGKTPAKRKDLPSTQMPQEESCKRMRLLAAEKHDDDEPSSHTIPVPIAVKPSSETPIVISASPEVVCVVPDLEFEEPVEGLSKGEGCPALALLELPDVLEHEEALDWGVESEGHLEAETALQELGEGSDIMQIQTCPSNPTLNPPGSAEGIAVVESLIAPLKSTCHLPHV